MIAVVAGLEVLTRFLDGGYIAQCPRCSHIMRFPTTLHMCPVCGDRLANFVSCSEAEYKLRRADDAPNPSVAYRAACKEDLN